MHSCPRRRTFGFGFALATTLFVSPLAAQIYRLGIPLQHTVADGFTDYGVQLACASGGGFIASWVSQTSATEVQIVARTFAFDATPTSAEIPVSAPSELLEYPPSLARDGAGNFVVAWWVSDAEGAGNAGVRLRMFSSAGVGGAEFGANSHTTGNQMWPRVARRSSGEFVVVWEGVGPGSVTGIWMRRFDAAGAPLAVETLVEAGAMSFPDIAMDPTTGAFVVAWERSDGDFDIRARRFDAAGSPLGAIFDVNSSTTGDQRYPAVALDTDGDFTIVYSGEGQGDDQGALGQLFDDTGAPIGGEYWVNATLLGYTGGVAAEFTSSGSFLVVFTIQQSGDPFRSYAARFSAAGVRDGFSDFPIRLGLALDRNQVPGRLCRDGAETFRVPLSERPFSGFDEEFLSQRLSLGLFADGFESEDDDAWSSSSP